MIGDCHTAALVSKYGSIDWLCLPHFDSPACFKALIGTAENGFWSISPAEPIRAVRRRYRDGSLILETGQYSFQLKQWFRPAACCSSPSAADSA
jgi:GH15 family glucan-1,4-alpha-glucosidase